MPNTFPAAVRLGDDLLAFGRTQADWLLEQHVLAGTKSGDRDRCMEMVRHRDADRIDIGAGKDVFVVRRVLGDVVLLADFEAARNVQTCQ